LAPLGVGIWLLLSCPRCCSRLFLVCPGRRWGSVARHESRIVAVLPSFATPAATRHMPFERLHTQATSPRGSFLSSHLCLDSCKKT
jgi:hypothetical protein